MTRSPVPLTPRQQEALDTFLRWQGRTPTRAEMYRGRRGVVVELEHDGPLVDGDIRQLLGPAAGWTGSSLGADRRDHIGVQLGHRLFLDILV
jgi:hypothetical protein